LFQVLIINDITLHYVLERVGHPCIPLWYSHQQTTSVLSVSSVPKYQPPVSNRPACQLYCLPLLSLDLTVCPSLMVEVIN